VTTADMYKRHVWEKEQSTMVWKTHAIQTTVRGTRDNCFPGMAEQGSATV